MLDRVVRKLAKSSDPNVILGSASFDDAGVYQMENGPALVQTVDFFTPVVDDPYDYGRISAANSLSDIYAMGARPITALNIAAFPDAELPESVLSSILRGASDICRSAGVAIIGGHTISDREIKFGLSVTGIADPEKLMRKDKGEAGDILILTKPLGSGLLANALMNNAAKEEDIAVAVEVMTRLNRVASEAAVKAGCRCATDVSGFGLVGHLKEIASASGLAAQIDSESLPILPGAFEIASGGSFFSGGERKNLLFVKDFLIVGKKISNAIQRIAADPQTSGGLLLAIPAGKVDSFESLMKDASEEIWIIGSLISGDPGSIILE
ncbi:MAG: selenide, water dikinase SelD [Candidatus Krumholzibacteriota bacterium]|nr:selenide, water dikinase SelD [Candidatus Krumholzibacteriota bacterium]